MTRIAFDTFFTSIFHIDLWKRIEVSMSRERPTRDFPLLLLHTISRSPLWPLCPHYPSPFVRRSLLPPRHLSTGIDTSLPQRQPWLPLHAAHKVTQHRGISPRGGRTRPMARAEDTAMQNV
ncbi:hypothetical protein V2G26_006077 [Clonostachys chloroleuca]